MSSEAPNSLPAGEAGRRQIPNNNQYSSDRNSRGESDLRTFWSFGYWIIGIHLGFGYWNLYNNAAMTTRVLYF